MYRGSHMDAEEQEESIPSWLKDENVMGGTAESVPIAKSTIQKTSSYGGQSASSAERSAEVDYGTSNTPVRVPDVSWAEEKVTEEDEEDDEESLEEEESSEEESSSEEEETDEEANWHEEPDERTSLKKSTRRRRNQKYRYESDDDSDVGFSVKPRRNCCHSFFILVQIASVLAILCMIALEVVPMAILLNQGTIQQKDLLDLVLRGYFTFFCIFFLLAELEWVTSSLNNWVLKGFSYTFLGVVAKEQHLALIANGTLKVKDFEDGYWDSVGASLVVEITSWWIIGCGCLYFLMGALCMKPIRNRFRRNYQSRMRAYLDQERD